MKITFKRFLRIHIPLLAAVSIYLLLPIKCPVKFFLRVDCPTCGMTRAVLSLLKGDFSGYMSLNPLALPFLFLLLFALHKRLLPVSRKTSDAVIIAGSVLVAAAYIFRIFL